MVSLVRVPPFKRRLLPKGCAGSNLIQFDKPADAELAWENILLPAMPMRLLVLYPRTGVSVLVCLSMLSYPSSPLENLGFDHPTPSPCPSPGTGCQFLVRPCEEGKLTLNIGLEKLYRLKYSNISHKIPLFRGCSTLINGLCL